jgi:Zn-dependent alcohol dehydrogenase
MLCKGVCQGACLQLCCYRVRPSSASVLAEASECKTNVAMTADCIVQAYTLTMHTNDVQCTLYACIYNCTYGIAGTRGRTQLPEMVNDYMNGELKVDEFVTDVFDLDKINDAFDSMHSGLAIRPVVKMRV